ncbi:hypothetical protein T265_07164 [Opisthorchis viverrini]|uniref:Uncharacterized protein n=1 Tax=Opisthorchis viverrini TaxID=6198 RepID=A0A075ACB6_OPIVI|nr:hypothetical protein T265_07164 [Opisthorchis viverrini]KER25364.1 hypothetical protein T265_07164 [Opisthorchis viverrini]
MVMANDDHKSAIQLTNISEPPIFRTVGDERKIQFKDGFQKDLKVKPGLENGGNLAEPVKEEGKIELQ